MVKVRENARRVADLGCVRGAVPGMALEQPRAGSSRNGKTTPSGSARSSARSRGPFGGAEVAERVPGDRLQQEGLDLRFRQVTGAGAVHGRRDRGGRRVRVVLGELQRRHGNADLPQVAVLFAGSGECLLGLLGLAEASSSPAPPAASVR